MLGIGPAEFVIIAVVALMLFSPRELPQIIRGVAKFWASLRNTADEFRDAIMNEEELHDLRETIKGGADQLRKAEASARRELMKARMDMQKAQNKLLQATKATEQAKRIESPASTPSSDETDKSTPPSQVDPALEAREVDADELDLSLPMPPRANVSTTEALPQGGFAPKGAVAGPNPADTLAAPADTSATTLEPEATSP